MIKSELNELSALLDAASDGHKKTDHKPKPLCEYDMFMKENVNEKNKKDPCNDKKRDSKSEVHQGETDSSDDENNRNPADQKYNDYGCTIKHLLKTKCTTVPEKACPRNMSWKNKQSTFAAPIEKKSFPNQKNDIYTEPYFGLRIVTPLISSTEFNLCMQDKDPVTFSRLQSQIEKTHPEGYHWVVAGVIVGKKIKQSQKGKPYVIWTLSDLKDRMETVSLFLFGNAYQKLWKTNENTVVAVLNPKPLDTHKQSSDIATLSVIEAERVMVLGQSKDMGTCRAIDACDIVVSNQSMSEVIGRFRWDPTVAFAHCISADFGHRRHMSCGVAVAFSNWFGKPGRMDQVSSHLTFQGHRDKAGVYGLVTKPRYYLKPFNKDYDMAFAHLTTHFRIRRFKYIICSVMGCVHDRIQLDHFCANIIRFQVETGASVHIVSYGRNWNSKRIGMSFDQFLATLTHNLDCMKPKTILKEETFSSYKESSIENTVSLFSELHVDVATDRPTGLETTPLEDSVSYDEFASELRKFSDKAKKPLTKKYKN